MPIRFNWHPLFAVIYDKAEHSIELLGGIFAKYLIEG